MYTYSPTGVPSVDASRLSVRGSELIVLIGRDDPKVSSGRAR